MHSCTTGICHMDGSSKDATRTKILRMYIETPCLRIQGTPLFDLKCTSNNGSYTVGQYFSLSFSYIRESSFCRKNEYVVLALLNLYGLLDAVQLQRGDLVHTHWMKRHHYMHFIGTLGSYSIAGFRISVSNHPHAKRWPCTLS